MRRRLILDEETTKTEVVVSKLSLVKARLEKE